MSQPIKYWTSRNGGITANKVWAINDASDNSALVAYSDYAALAAENERLNHKLGRLLMAEKEWELVEPGEYARIKNENKRLRKAGDAMEKRLEFFQKRWDCDELCQEVIDWLAAKEGRDAK